MTTYTRVNNEFFVSFALAVILREVGYDYPCSRGYSKDGSGWTDTTAENWNDEFHQKEYYLTSMPRLFDVQTWLRDTKKIDIFVYPCFDHINYGYDVYSHSEAENYDSTDFPEGTFKSFEEALGRAILFAAEQLVKNS